MEKIELLAPAGNFECMVAAVQSGADAVYISGKNFGARSFAENFDSDELIRAVDYCHLRSTGVYVTVNTLIYDDEFEKLEKYLYFLNDIGVDALIVQDLGVIETAQRIIPQMPLHASTQMTIHNACGVRALEKIGISRIVLARELSLKNINDIPSNCCAELEVFAHGALCMCYSGQCLMSSIIGGRSGNRGKCAQPCRLPYSVSDTNKTAFFMSLKDLCSLEHIESMVNAGVKSLKIEGRMKGAAYVAATVRVYRKYIDNLQRIHGEDLKLLDSIFNRGGLTDGYLTGKTGKEMFAFDKPDNPYRKENDELIRSLTVYEDTENRKMRLKCYVNITEGEYPVICITDGQTRIDYKYSKKVESAIKQPLTTENVRMRFLKTGGTPFEFSEVNVNIEGNAFLTVGDLNSLRRESLEEFEKKFLLSFKNRKKVLEKDVEIISVEYKEKGFVCEVTNKEQFEAACRFNFLRFYVPIDLVCESEDYFLSFKEKIVLVLPAVMNDQEMQTYTAQVTRLMEKGFDGVVVSNIGSIEQFGNCKLYGGFRLNVSNTRSLDAYRKKNIAVMEVSPEINLKKIKKLKKTIPIQTMVYGRLPLMVTENCVIKNGDKCPCSSKTYITDRIGVRFPVIRDGVSCRNIILNGKRTFMADKIDDVKNAGVSFFRLYFTDENADECIKVCEAYLNNSDYCPTDYTRAHYYKGAE